VGWCDPAPTMAPPRYIVSGLSSCMNFRTRTTLLEPSTMRMCWETRTQRKKCHVRPAPIHGGASVSTMLNLLPSSSFGCPLSRLDLWLSVFLRFRFVVFAFECLMSGVVSFHVSRLSALPVLCSLVLLALINFSAYTPAT
jgi:hypothetical protein